MPDDLTRQIAELTKAVSQLTDRVSLLERRPKAVTQPPTPLAGQAAVQLSGPRTKTVAINPGARAGVAIGGFIALFMGSLSGWLVLLGFAALILALLWPWTRRVTVASTGVGAQVPTAPAVTPHAPAQPRQPSRFEQDLAKHWFSWLGIISLVVGITLLLNYAFRGFGPIGRIFTGYASAGMLFCLWYWLKRMYRGFAFVLQGGAWAIVYISTFALHVIEGQPVSSAVVAGSLLLSVVAIIIIAALLQRSKALTVGAFFLGYVTAFTNDVSLFTLAALLTMSIGVAAVSSVQAWPEFVLAGTLATYAVQAAWMLKQYSLSDVAGTAGGFLVLEVLVFGAAHWLMSPATARQRQMIIGGTILNLVGFYALFNYAVKVINNPHGWLATLFIGLVCAILAAATAVAASRRFLRPVYTVFAIAFTTLALGQWLHGNTLTWAYLIESTAVVCLGAMMNERTIRYSGYAVSFMALVSLFGVMSGPATTFGATGLHSRLILGLLGALLTAISAAVLRYRKAWLTSGERYVSTILADVAIVLGMSVAGQELRAAWVPVVWSLGSLGLLALGLRLKSSNARIVSYLIAIFSAFFWIASVMGSTALAGNLNIHARLLAGVWVVAMCLVSVYLVRQQPSGLTKEESSLPTWYMWAAVIMLTIVLGAEVPSRLLSVAWGIEGVVLYIMGFAGQRLSARRQGLLVLGLTIAKVYVIDVRTLAPPYRILSFIILGVILLGVGFLYNRWRQQKAPSPQ